MFDHIHHTCGVQVLLSLARVLKEVGRSDAAAAAYRKVIALEPNRPSVHYKLATILRQLGRRQQAAASYRFVPKCALHRHPAPAGQGGSSQRMDECSGATLGKY
jgi:hypothetical protein